MWTVTGSFGLPGILRRRQFFSSRKRSHARIWTDLLEFGASLELSRSYQGFERAS